MRGVEPDQRAADFVRDRDIQRARLLEAIRDRLDAGRYSYRLELPPFFEIEPGPDFMRVHYAPPHHRDSVDTVRSWWSLGNPKALEPETLEWAVGLAERAIRIAAQCDGIGDHDRDPPAWKVLAHPVALMMAIAHEPDRTRYPRTLRRHGTAGERNWDVDDAGLPSHPGRHCTAVADAALVEGGELRINRLGTIMPRTMSAVTFSSDPDRGAKLSFPTPLPDTLMDGIVGRTLAEVVELPSCGVAEIDRAAGACVIDKVEPLANGISVTFRPTDHLPYGVAPDDGTARAMRLAPPRH